MMRIPAEQLFLIVFMVWIVLYEYGDAGKYKSHVLLTVTAFSMMIRVQFFWIRKYDICIPVLGSIMYRFYHAMLSFQQE